VHASFLTFILRTQVLEAGDAYSNALLIAPSSCLRGMVKAFVEQSGETYEPVKYQGNATEAVTDAARHVVSAAAVVTVLSWILLAIAM
jgi:hypothetical protein